MKTELLDKLRKWSNKKDSFSIRSFADEVKIPYRSILAFCKEDDDWKYEIEKARNHLACNAENALNSGLVPTNEGLRYLYENDFFLQESMRSSGKNVPEDPDQFDEWIEKQLVLDNEEMKANRKKYY